MSEEAEMHALGQRVGEVLIGVVQERYAQHQKWGNQNHPDGTGPSEWPMWNILDRVLSPGINDASELLVADASSLSAEAKRACQSQAESGNVTWRDILLEEVFEALAESDPVKLRAELIQVAAVAVQWVEVIDEKAEKR